ncbi:hypothetical protein C8F01DRAFT_1087702 [Mycena amicta]|nr:hypothetical protein C8F01DRAFT_1087702 [Mycena amicta]
MHGGKKEAAKGRSTTVTISEIWLAGISRLTGPDEPLAKFVSTVAKDCKSDSAEAKVRWSAAKEKSEKRSWEKANPVNGKSLQHHRTTRIDPALLLTLLLVLRSGRTHTGTSYKFSRIWPRYKSFTLYLPSPPTGTRPRTVKYVGSCLIGSAAVDPRASSRRKDSTFDSGHVSLRAKSYPVNKTSSLGGNSAQQKARNSARRRSPSSSASAKSRPSGSADIYTFTQQGNRQLPVENLIRKLLRVRVT